MSSAAVRAVENITALTARDAAALADEILDQLIAALRRDQGNARTSDEWTLALANLRERIAELLAQHVVGRVDLEEVLRTLEATYES
jgi:hypothetical protein